MPQAPPENWATPGWSGKRSMSWIRTANGFPQVSCRVKSAPLDRKVCRVCRAYKAIPARKAHAAPQDRKDRAVSKAYAARKAPLALPARRVRGSACLALTTAMTSSSSTRLGAGPAMPGWSRVTCMSQTAAARSSTKAAWKASPARKAAKAPKARRGREALLVRKPQSFMPTLTVKNKALAGSANL